MKFTHLYIITVSFFVVFQSQGATQKRTSTLRVPTLEELPQRPVDTLSTPDPETKVILYSNNTWSYFRPTLEAAKKHSIYTQHWDTTGVFAYKSIELSDLPSIIDLKLVADLSEFHYPILGKVLSKYGIRRRRNHNGVDIPLKTGEPIYSTFDGYVRYAKFNTGGFGNLVIVRHQNGLETWYAHLSKLNAGVNDYVKAGQVIGFGGSTGRSRGPHLHFEMRYCDQTFDPEFILDFETGQLKYQTFALEKSFFNIHSRASEILDEDDEYDIPLLASGDSDTTQTDILERILEAQNKSTSNTTKTAPPAGINQSGSVYHTIKSGDILGRIASRYGVTIDQICRLNGISRNTTLRLGRKLRVK